MSYSETWVINEWLPEESLKTKCSYSINFISNGEQYSSISFKGIGVPSAYGLVYDLKYDNVVAYDCEFDQWSTEEYRTITLLEPPNEELGGLK